jgi:hypothetical protein
MVCTVRAEQIPGQRGLTCYLWRERKDGCAIHTTSSLEECTDEARASYELPIIECATLVYPACDEVDDRLCGIVR